MRRRWAAMVGALAIGTFTLALAQTGAAAPTVSANCGPLLPGCQGWTAANGVLLNWTVLGATWIEPGTCAAESFASEGYWERRCVASDGNDITGKVAKIGIDRTAPQVTGVNTTVPPNASGWFTSPVTIAFVGSDAVAGLATSGIASCDAPTYAGPDTSSVTVVGRCRDGAGHVSAPFAYAFRYDATPPVLRVSEVVPGDRSVRLRWATNAERVVVRRTPGLSGRRRVALRGGARGLLDTRVAKQTRYSYEIIATDQAGNTVARTVRTAPARRLLAPRNRAKVPRRPTRLRWSEIRGARYYNLQVFRNGRKILSVWPRTTGYTLPRTWRFQGSRYRLTPGTYVWYVWPGIGAFAKQQYGRIIGQARFTVTR